MDKKNNIINITIILFTVGIIGFGGALIYLSVKNKTSGSAVAIDEHGHTMAANVSLASLNNLIDKPAPDFSLSDRDGNVYSPETLRGKNVVLFFNEGLMCYPACWNQIVALAQDERFQNEETVVLSVVVDSKKEWQMAINKMPELGRAKVVFDNGAVVSKKFGTLTTSSSMHYGSFPGHTYFVIDKESIIRHIFDDPNMAIYNNQLAMELSKLN